MSWPAPSIPMSALAMATAGLAFGLAYFALTYRTAVLLVGGRGRLAAIFLTLGRLGAAAVFLGSATRAGAASLIAAFLGLLLARAVALRIARRER